MSTPSWITCLVLGALLASASGCASSSPIPPPNWEPSPNPEATIAAEPQANEVESDVPRAPLVTAPDGAAGQEALRDASVIVIDEPVAPKASDLVSASRSAREQRERNPATTKITNKNLKDYAGGLVTTAKPKSPEAKAEDAAVESASREEQEWRERILDLRMRSRRSRDEIHRLESEAALLRRSFYVEDDPYVRDSRIKPAWDRALDNLNLARRDAAAFQLDLARALDEARQQGALPGWLREGIDLENDLDAPPAYPALPSIEPPIAAEPREPISPP